MNFKKKTAGAAAAAVVLTAALCSGAVLLGAYAEELPAPAGPVVVSEPMLPSKEPRELQPPAADETTPPPAMDGEFDFSNPDPPHRADVETGEQLAVSALIAEKSAEIDWDALALTDETLAYPLDGAYTTLTNCFGIRVHPLTGRAVSHPGLDIKADGGAEVYASRSGVVLLSANGAEYGNYVVVGYGDGESVLYAQMTANTVVEGDRVDQGQVVGYVGSTGNATGAHLHMELRENGDRVDPEPHFPDQTFTRQYER